MVDIELAIGLLILITGWQLWRKVSLDECRDNLFDLRKHLRNTFLENGFELDDPVYQEARYLLNGKIRLADSVTFLNLLIFKIRGCKSGSAEIGKTGDGKVDSKVSEILESANAYLIIYIVESSPIVLPLAVGLSLWILCQRGLLGLNSLKLKVANRLVSDKNPLDKMALATN